MFPFNFFFLRLRALSVIVNIYARKFILGDPIIMSKELQTFETIPEGGQVRWIINVNAPSTPETQLQLDSVECDIDQWFLVSECSRDNTFWNIVWCKCSPEDWYFKAVAVWLFDSIIPTSSSKCALCLSKADEWHFTTEVKSGSQIGSAPT